MRDAIRQLNQGEYIKSSYEVAVPKTFYPSTPAAMGPSEDAQAKFK